MVACKHTQLTLERHTVGVCDGHPNVLVQNGTLKIIDRKKHIFKLAQGEYISPEKIENIYIRSEPVAQLYVHGDSLQVINLTRTSVSPYLVPSALNAVNPHFSEFSSRFWLEL